MIKDQRRGIPKRIAFLAGVLICAASLCSGCATTRKDETSEMRREMHKQMTAVRNQMRASGASATQLREFDKAMAEMDRLMRQTEKQMRAIQNASED